MLGSSFDFLPSKREGYRASAALVERRAALAALPPRYPPTPGVTQEEHRIGSPEMYASAMPNAPRAIRCSPFALHAMPGMHHVWPMLYPDLPETRQALEAMAAFTRDSLSWGRSDDAG